MEDEQVNLLIGIGCIERDIAIASAEQAEFTNWFASLT
jgi:hypothetical protein